MTHDDLSSIEGKLANGYDLPCADAKLLLEQLRANAARAVSVDKRLADAERKLQPGDVSPDMHACERAIRDLETLARVRAHPLGAQFAKFLSDGSTGVEDAPPDEEAFVADLIALLSPGDAGRGESK